MSEREGIERRLRLLGRELDEMDLADIGREALIELRRLQGLNPDGTPMARAPRFREAVGQ